MEGPRVDLGVRLVPVGEALAMALDGRITDALSLVAIMSYALGRPAPRDVAG